MKITEDELERLVAGLFGDGLTQGNIEFFNDKDDVPLQTRDLDEVIDFDPTHISLETTANELVGFGLPADEVPSHFPAPSAEGGGLKLWFYESAIDGDLIPQYGEPVVEIPLISYTFNEDNFYETFDFEEVVKDSKLLSKVDKSTKISIALAPTAAAKKGGWKNVEGTFGGVIEMLTLHQEGKKDGTCFLQGELAGNDRSGNALVKNYFIGFDLDTGETAEEIDARLAETGLAYVRYTTHSHMKDESEVKRDAFFRWSGRDATKNVEINLLRKYLISERGFLPRVVETLDIIEDAKVSQEGTLTIIRHKQMPKHRIIFFLSEPFVFQGKANQREEQKAWKEHYHGLGTELGFVYDHSCTDPARLFYMPRHAKDSPYETRFVDGEYVDLRSYDRIEMKRGDKSDASNAFQDAGKSLGAKGEGLYVDGYNLKRWIATRDCEIVDLIEEYYPDAIRTPRTNGPGFHIECPFEDEHSKAGGAGTYAINASDGDTGFMIHCTHNSCAGRNKLEYVQGMVELEWFTVDDLQDERFCPSLIREEPEEKSDEKKPLTQAEVNIPALIDSISQASQKDDVIDIVRQIGRLDDLDEDDFEVYLSKISRKTKIPKKILKKHLPTKYEKTEEDKNKKLDELDKRLHKYNERYAMVDTGSKVVIMDSHKKDMTFTGRDDWKALKANEKILIHEGNEPRLEHVSKLWLEWEQRRTYEGVTFDPRPNPDPSKFNLFKGFETIARKGNWDKLKNHIFEVICHNNEEHYLWVLTWLAHIVQRPWEKKGSAIVVRGLKGVGKSLVFTIFQDIMGKYGMSSANASHITGQFNWHFRDKLFMIAEEGLFAGNAREDSILKELITGSSLLMEPKGIDAFQMENYLRIVIISNEEWVVNASSDERRYFVTEASDKYKDDIVYFKGIIEQMENGGKEAMMYDLLHFEPQGSAGWDVLRQPPKTDALRQQVTQSMHVWEKFFVTLVENMGIDEVSSQDLDKVELDYGIDNWVDPKILRQHYYNSLKTSQSRYKADPKTFQKLADQYLLAKMVRRKRQNNEVWMKLPPLETIMDHIQNKLKIKLDMINITEE
jgi:hypothetical protein